MPLPEDELDSQKQIDRPIFFIGMPRSGTTVMFAAFAAHPSLAWFSQYMHRFPRLTILAAISRLADLWPDSRAGVARYGETWSILNRLQLSPAESAGDDYGVWTHCCGEKLENSFLTGVEPTPEERNRLCSKVAKTLSLQGKDRFAAKLTGPPRIGYLSAAFDDAVFVNVIRDPRAVVGSLMRVPFWRDTYRYTSPAWTGGLTEEELQTWREDGESPVALAAIELRAVLERGREEAQALAPDRYIEIRYEDFIANPVDRLGAMFEFAQLPFTQKPYDYVDDRVEVRDLTESWRKHLSVEEVGAIEAAASAVMHEFGYSREVV
jgi:omega-hydroxy-beta-dihydromenaquinone-9 sulfotransferase